jgi:hypothetical protein
MTTERIWRRIAAVCLPLAAAGLLAACGDDDEASRSATTTTPATATVGGRASAATTTPAASASATTTPAAAANASGGATAGTTAATPGVGSQSATLPGGTNAAASCSSSLGRRADSAAIDPATLANAEATPDITTTPDTTTTTPAVPAATSTRLRASDENALARPFSTGSPWNTPVDTLAVDRRSELWVQRASRRLAVVASRNQEGVETTERRAKDLGLYVNTCAWTPAIVGEGEGQSVRVVCRQRNCGNVARELQTLRIPNDVDPLPEFDGWFSVIDESAGVGYDMWRARRVGNVISYQFIKRWLLDGPGFSAPATRDPIGAVGARGSGLPLFAGVIQPNELRQGRIEHALAISLPGPAQRIFVQPASVTNGVNALESIPEGARLRLKSNFKLGKLERGANKRSADAIVTALRTYGAIVVDRSITPTLYAARSDYGTTLVGNELQGVELSDLDVVQTGSLLRYPPLESTFEAVQG